MADPRRRLKQNVAGEFFVDDTCIDCDTCRQIAPATFRDHGDQSSVFHQPENPGERMQALKALVCCPTASIGTDPKTKDAVHAVSLYPERIAENVYYCGFNSEKTFGGWSYLIVRPQERGGNVLVDSPRFTQPLVRKIHELGGLKQMFLTHRDDIADHAAFAREFRCPRVMHEADRASTLGIERVISAKDPASLDDDLLAIPPPGHTRGHVVLLYGNRFLFTGDHLAWSLKWRTLIAFRNACWYSWEEQTRSMERLLPYRFEWVLPGHGRIHFASSAEMQAHLSNCVDWMKSFARKGHPAA